MRKKSEILIRALSLLMTLLLISGTLACGIFSAGAATTTNNREKTTYDIAVVYDNSGSMYWYESTAWSQAKYSMEIFASMLDFSKDKLSIYPMWDVTTDGESNSGGSHKPIEVLSKQDIKKIHEMYTPVANGTPFEPVDEAYKQLSSSKADEKWLIVITDGQFNMMKRTDENTVDLDSNEVADYLKDKIKNGIKMQYIGFDEAYNLTSDEGNGFYAVKCIAGSLESELVKICNRMFQRIVLPSDKLVNGKLRLDVSMEKIIVFVQGKGSTIGTLSHVDGDKAEVLQDSDPILYSDRGAGEYQTSDKYDCVPDKSLAGQVVTFGACRAGEYILDYDATEIQIFYEPDIDIQVDFIDEDGKIVKPENGELLEGEYKIKTSIVDRNTGDNILADGHPGKELLGDVELITSYKYSDEDDSQYRVYDEYHGDQIKSVEELQTITLEPDKTIDIDISGHYLNFDIKDNNKIDLSWLKGLKIEQQVIPFEVKAEVLQPDSYYYHKDKGDWEPIKVTFTLDGKPLTKEQLAATQFSLGFKEELQYTYEMNENESAIYVYIDGNRDTENMEPTGKYKFTVSATYVNEKGKETTATDKVEFDIAKIAKWIIDIIKLLIALAILTLIALWLIHPVLPKRVIVSEGHFTKNATIKGSFKMPSRFDVRSVPVSGKAKVVPKMRNSWIMSLLKPKRMNFKVVDINCSGISELTVDGVTYTAQNGKLYDTAGDEVKSMIIGNSAVSWDENKGGLFEGTLNINKR